MGLLGIHCLLDFPPCCTFHLRPWSPGSFVYLGQRWEVMSDPEDSSLAEKKKKFVELIQARIQDLTQWSLNLQDIFCFITSSVWKPVV